MKDQMLILDGQADKVRRLVPNPPAEWDGETAWSAHNGPSGVVLMESAVIECPDCEETAFWRNGFLRCEGCGGRKLIG